MWRCVLALVLAGLSAAVSGPRLFKMSQIRGWISGAVVTREVLSEKGVIKAEVTQIRSSTEDKYWVSWAKEGEEYWEKQDFVAEELWRQLQVGDSVDVVQLPGESETCLRIGKSADPRSCATEFVLFVVAIGICTAVVARHLRYWLGKRSTKSAVQAGSNGTSRCA